MKYDFIFVLYENMEGLEERDDLPGQVSRELEKHSRILQ